MYTFDQPGKNNTSATLEFATKRGEELGISNFVVASNTGETAALLAEMILEQKTNLVCVKHHIGFKEPGLDEMPEEMERKLFDQGVKIHAATHLFANMERAVTQQFGGLYPGGIVSAALRCFGQGVKVCFEISTMALDAGLVPYGTDIIAIGGTGRGADAAVVIQPEHGNNFFNTRLKEIICKPR